MVVFDLSDERSLSNASRWMADACENADEPVKFLVGTKKDKLVRLHICKSDVFTCILFLKYNHLISMETDWCV